MKNFFFCFPFSFFLLFIFFFHFFFFLCFLNQVVSPQASVIKNIVFVVLVEFVFPSVVLSFSIFTFSFFCLSSCFLFFRVLRVTVECKCMLSYVMTVYFKRYLLVVINFFFSNLTYKKNSIFFVTFSFSSLQKSQKEFQLFIL